LFFDAWHGATESFILVVSLLNAALPDRKDGQLCNGSPILSIADHSFLMYS